MSVVSSSVGFRIVRASLPGVLVSCVLGSVAAQAAGGVTTTSPVIVSASRVAETVDETLAPVSVVTRDDMERLQARSVQDVLRGLPGVSMVNNGGQGRATSLFLRGSESDHVLVLIDGVKVGSATLGSFGFQDIPVEQIERIEVVRGPRAALYGSEAIGGVVQIFTRKGAGEVKPFARVTAGSRHTYESAAGLSGGNGRAWFNASGTISTTRGIDACSGSPTLFAGCFVDEPDRDGYRNRSLSLRGGYRLGDAAEVELHALTSTGFVEADGSIFAGNERDQRKRVLGGKLSYAPLDAWLITVRGGRSRDESDSFKDSVFVSEFITRRDTFSVQNDIEIGSAHLLTVGGDWQRDGVDSSTPYPVRGRWNKAAFAQVRGTWGAHDVQLAGRHDRNQQFGVANTGNVAWGWALRDGVRLVASYGTAFKAPSFNELYFPFQGNPALEPERSRTGELSLRGTTGATRWSIGVFRSKVRNLISFPAPTFVATNVDKATIKGIEASLATRIMDFDIAANATLLQPIDRSRGANNGNVLPRRARRVVNLDVDRHLGAFSAGASVHVEGSRYDDAANTRELGGFTVVDLRAEYRFASAWSIQGRIENALDKRYETASYFNQPGRGAFVTLRYQP